MSGLNLSNFVQCWAGAIVVWLFAISSVSPAATEVEQTFRQSILPILSTYCFDCHANGAREGDMALDDADSERALIGNRQLWWDVLKNVRAGIMPPMDQDRPTAAEQLQLFDWIKTGVFGVDPQNPDPGSITVRRLNRAEYRNTIRDLMGIDFNAEVVFPPDDTGFGFDNVGDVLSLSPMLLEKYLQAARTIVQQSVPIECKVVPRQALTGEDFRDAVGDAQGGQLRYDTPATVSKTVQVDVAGRYEIQLEVQLHGSFDFSPDRCHVTFLIDDEAHYEETYAWDERKSIHYQFKKDWPAGDHRLTFELRPLPPQEEKQAAADNDGRYVHFHILHVDVVGPEDPNHWQHPPNYERFFTRDEPPASADKRRDYAREVLARFAKRAFRRAAPEHTLEQLVELAEATYQQPQKTFEAGIAQAITAILASPRFLFRLEAADPDSQDRFPLVDEYTLASRLSYLFWSTMPDDELMRLAERGVLRNQLEQQVQRLLRDERSAEFVRNFVGQWLRARDVEHVSLDPLVATGFGEEYEQLRSVFRRRFRAQEGDAAVTNEEWERTRARFSELRAIREKFDGRARQAMRRETEMLFEYIVREDRSVLELIDSDYTFLNEKLADLYDVPGVTGDDMRRVVLPPDSPRGGVLAQATFLTVTSNPTRTSPVKRGLFILENILGTPSAPPPANVPELEEAAKQFGDREPTLREVLAAHREAALCSSCHARMDPLGIALENFNALGMWREQEHGQPIDASGELITGEAFQDVRELKRILIEHHREDFYRCLTGKLMTYALGRGLDYYDEFTVDRIVTRVDQADGRFGVLLREIVNSPPFQRRRCDSVAAASIPTKAH